MQFSRYVMDNEKFVRGSHYFPPEHSRTSSLVHGYSSNIRFLSVSHSTHCASAFVLCLPARLRLFSSLSPGDGEIRTLDPLLARQVLSQLSYTPKKSGTLLLSHTVSSIVPSAAWVLTIVFGMGTGVSPTRIGTGYSSINPLIPEQ